MSESGYITLALSRLLETWDRDNGPVDIGRIVGRARNQYDELRKRVAHLELLVADLLVLEQAVVDALRGMSGEARKSQGDGG